MTRRLPFRLTMAAVALCVGVSACGSSSLTGSSPSGQESGQSSDDGSVKGFAEPETIKVLKACSLADFSAVAKKMKAKTTNRALEQKFGYGGNPDGVACQARLEAKLRYRFQGGKPGTATGIYIVITVAIVPLNTVEDAKRHFDNRMRSHIDGLAREKNPYQKTGAIDGPWDQSAGIDGVHTSSSGSWDSYVQVRKANYLVAAYVLSEAGDAKNDDGTPVYYDKLPYDKQGLRALAIEQLKQTYDATGKELAKQAGK